MSTKYGHSHAEAFALMAYACQCGHQESIWNSRDGVTPFCGKCPNCGNLSLLHVDWDKDIYAPEYKLSAGQRFWRDGTPDEAEAIMQRRIDKVPTYLSPGQAAKLIKEARDGNGGEYRKGWPT